MLTNNKEIHYSRTILTLSKISVWLFFGLLGVSILLLIFKEIYISKNLRTILTIISLLPIIYTIYLFSAYENIFSNRKYKNESIMKIALLLIYLFIPSIIFVFRYYNPIGWLSILLGGVGIILNYLKPFIGQLERIDISKIIREVYFEAWKRDDFNINNNYFEQYDFHTMRKNEYFNPKNLNEFQKTFNKISNEHQVLAQAILESSFKNTHLNPIDVLDVGGHNGIFTSKLLLNIGLDISSILNIDPNSNSDYSNNLKSVTNNIETIKNVIEDYSNKLNKNYDLIIASHSLYSVIDEGVINVNLLLNKLTRLLKKDGILLVLLGSKNSTAYRLKKEIIQFLNNESISDSNAELFIESIDRSHKFKVFTIDNYFISSDLIENNEKLQNWVTYFTRLNVPNNNFILNQIKKMIIQHSINIKELPECVGDNNFSIDDKTMGLTHKTIGIIISYV